MVKGWQDFTVPTSVEAFIPTASISIDKATINLWPIRLLETGEIKRKYMVISAGLATLYTVPSGKRFFLFHFDLNASHYATGPHLGMIRTFYAGVAYPFGLLAGPDSVDHMHTEGSFTIFMIPEGWEIEGYANDYTTIRVSIIGVEITA